MKLFPVPFYLSNTSLNCFKSATNFWGLISNFSDFGAADREMIFEQPGRTRLFNGRTLARLWCWSPKVRSDGSGWGEGG